MAQQFTAPANALEAAGWLEAKMDYEKLQLDKNKDAREEVGLGLDTIKVAELVKTGEVDRTVAMADLGIRQEDLAMRQEEFGWKRKDKAMQQKIQDGMIQAAQEGGYGKAIDFLKSADPERAIDFHTKKLALDNAIMQNDVMQQVAPLQKNTALFESYALGGKMMAGIFSLPEDQQAEAFKIQRPMIAKVNPNVSEEWDDRAKAEGQVMIAMSTPEAQLYQARTDANKMQGVIGKNIEDLHAIEQKYGRGSKEAFLAQQSLESNITAKGVTALRAAQVMAVKKQGGEDAIRKEWTAQNKNFLVAQDEYNKINAIAKDPGEGFARGVNDMSLIFSYMKVLDPTSVVRESEFATAENTTGVPDSVRRMYNKSLSGEKLSGEQRQSFVNGAKTLYETKLKSHDQLKGEYLKIVDTRGYDQQSAMPDLSNRAGGAPATQAPGGMITIRNKATGETKTVSADEAKAMGLGGQ